jgi:hypothetical protein
MLTDICTISFVGFLLYLYDITKDNYYKYCKKNIKVNLTLLLHHISNVFTQFGWLSNNKTILTLYLIIPPLIIVHWNSNNNRCILTEYTNKNCNIDQDSSFRDLWFTMGIKGKKYTKQFLRTYLIIVWFIALYKLYKIQKQ